MQRAAVEAFVLLLGIHFALDWFFIPLLLVFAAHVGALVWVIRRVGRLSLLGATLVAGAALLAKLLNSLVLWPIAEASRGWPEPGVISYDLFYWLVPLGETCLAVAMVVVLDPLKRGALLEPLYAKDPRAAGPKVGAMVLIVGALGMVAFGWSVTGRTTFGIFESYGLKGKYLPPTDENVADVVRDRLKIGGLFQVSPADEADLDYVLERQPEEPDRNLAHWFEVQLYDEVTGIQCGNWVVNPYSGALVGQRLSNC